MKISTKGIYGLKAMIDLAVNSSNDSVTLKSISERQHISERYLEQIFSALRKKDIIKGRKGLRGGYMLGMKMRDITVGNILRTLEGDLSVVDLKDASEELIDKCIRQNVWNKLNENIDKVVDSVTLEDLVSEYKKGVEENNLMYYI